ncbi:MULTISPECIES: hypothetical protein [unclassified Brevundimonas]|uniref:hypothetical protein n=1 Tax=unclassified Brevundimonas TaxID=2622653 RepID=UPI003F902A87
MAPPRPPRTRPVPHPDDEPDMHPAELRRLEKEFFARVDHLVAVFQRKHEASERQKQAPPEPPLNPNA